MAEDMSHNNYHHCKDNAALATTGVVLGGAGTLGALLNWVYNTFKGNGIPAERSTVERIVTSCAPLVEGMFARSGGCIGSAADAKLLSEIAELKGERYTDNKIQAEIEKNNATHVADLKEFYAQFISVRDDAATTKAELKCLNEKLTTYEITQREKAVLEKENADLKLGLVRKDFDCLADKVATGFAATNNRFAGVDAVIASITKTVVPGSVICGKTCGDCCTTTNAQQ